MWRRWREVARNDAFGNDRFPDVNERVEVDPPGRWRALAVLATAMFLAMATWFSTSAVLPQLRDRWDLTTDQASLLIIAVQIGFVVGAVASAVFNLADVVAPRRLMLLGALGAAAANAGIAAATSFGTALPLRFLTGVFLAGVYPAGLKAMATWFRRGRGLALGIMVGALTLGSAAPHFVNGIGGFEWQAVILVTSALTVAGGSVAELAGRDGPYPFPRGRFDPRQARRVVANREVVLASAGYFGHMWELYAMWAWFAAFYADALARRGGDDVTRTASLAAFAVIGIGAAGCWVGGLLADRYGRARIAALAMMLSGASAVTIGLVRNLPTGVVLAVGLVWGFWVVADSALFSTIVTEVADQAYVGTAVTLQLAAGFTLTVATIWLVPFLRDHLSWTWAFAFLAPGPLLGVWAMRTLQRSAPASDLAISTGG